MIWLPLAAATAAGKARKKQTLPKPVTFSAGRNQERRDARNIPDMRRELLRNRRERQRTAAL